MELRSAVLRVAKPRTRSAPDLNLAEFCCISGSGTRERLPLQVVIASHSCLPAGIFASSFSRLRLESCRVLFQLGCGCQQLRGFTANLFGGGLARHPAHRPIAGNAKARRW